MTREEYLLNPSLYCKRGFDLPQTKLPDAAIVEIRNSAIKRVELRREINEKYSNKALAKKYSVHESTIEKVLAYETGKHIY